MIPPSSLYPGSFTAVNAPPRPPDVQHAHTSNDDELPMMSMDDEPPILGHPRHPHQSQINHDRFEDSNYPFSQGNRGSGSYRTDGGGGGRVCGSLTNKLFQPTAANPSPNPTPALTAIHHRCRTSHLCLLTTMSRHKHRLFPPTIQLATAHSDTLWT